MSVISAFCLYFLVNTYEIVNFMKFYSKHQTFFSKYAILKMMKKGEKNEFLVVLKDTLIERFTFLYVQLQENKTLLHFHQSSI